MDNERLKRDCLCTLIILHCSLLIVVAAGCRRDAARANPPAASPSAAPAEVSPSVARTPLAGPNLTSTSGMVKIPGGTFRMGCSPGDADCADWETPPHPATVKSFWLDATTVTNAAYRHCVAAEKCYPPDEENCFKWGASTWTQGLDPAFKQDDQPIVCVNWNNATAYCRWLGKRLPTEAEWEFAARGRTTGPRYGDLDAIAWHHGNAGGKTHPVAEKLPNAYGLYDMSGNVWQWCDDWFDGNYYAASPADNPKGPPTGAFRVLRGGSWNVNPKFMRASLRAWYNPSHRYDDFGFRCARDDISP